MCKRFFTKVLLLGFLSFFVACPDSGSPSIQFDLSGLDGSLDGSKDVPGDLQKDVQKSDTDIYDSKTNETVDIVIDLPPGDADFVMDVEFSGEDVSDINVISDIKVIKDVNPNDDIGSSDPCSSAFNPECKPNKCDDGNSSTTNDHCQSWFGRCRCTGDIDRCSSQYNPQCLPSPCDDGDPNTNNDACRADGKGNCVCKGIPVAQDPCGSLLNPDCDPKACDDGNPNTKDDKCRVNPIPFTNDCRCRGKHVW